MNSSNVGRQINPPFNNENHSFTNISNIHPKKILVDTQYKPKLGEEISKPNYINSSEHEIYPYENEISNSNHQEKNKLFIDVQNSNPIEIESEINDNLSENTELNSEVKKNNHTANRTLKEIRGIIPQYGPDKQNIFVCRFADSKVDEYVPNKQMRKKYPLQLIKFYEKHIQGISK